MLVALGPPAKVTAWPAESPLGLKLTAAPGDLAAEACWAAQQRPDTAPAVAAWPPMPLGGRQMCEELVAGLVWTQLWAARPQLWLLGVVGEMQLVARRWQPVAGVLSHAVCLQEAEERQQPESQPVAVCLRWAAVP